MRWAEEVELQRRLYSRDEELWGRSAALCVVLHPVLGDVQEKIPQRKHLNMIALALKTGNV